MAIPDDFIQELLNRADIVDVVGRHVQLKKAGANFMGLCPFHAEKSPSFSVSPTKQFFHCFGCGKSGNAITFLREHAGMNFVEAVKDLAGEFGLEVPEDDRSPADRERAKEASARRATLADVLERAAGAYRKQLKTAPRAIDYLKGRGLSGEVARRFGLGWAPEGWRTLAGVFPDYADALLTESGLVITSDDGEKRYDRFRERIMFPIRNVKGECIGFGGRTIAAEKTDGPKYLNSPETPLFSKGRELYGLFEARQSLREEGYALVTEGYMDVVALAQLGFPNAVATLGTACTPEHVQKLFRFTDSVVFSFDGDAAGRRAAKKALESALPHAGDLRSIRFLFLPPEHDPDSYIRAHGRDAFARYVEGAMPLSQFIVESAREGADLALAEGRARLAANAGPLWLQIPDGALKRQLLAEIAGHAQMAADELESLWRPAARGRARGGAPRASGTPVWETDGRTASTRTRPGRIRQLPPGRADRALQILLTDTAAWSRLSSDDHRLLCELDAPHGPLFAWLDGYLLEHGPQPWDVVSEAIAAHERGADARSLVDRVHEAIESDPGELAQILERERARRQDDEMRELSTRAATDPVAYERLRELLSRRKTLQPAAAPDL